MQQSDVLYQCESQALNQGMDQNQTQNQTQNQIQKQIQNLNRPQNRANEPAADDAIPGAARKGSAVDAAESIVSGVSAVSTTAGERVPAAKVSAVAGERVPAAKVSAVAGERMPAAKVSAVAGESETATKVSATEAQVVGEGVAGVSIDSTLVGETGVSTGSTTATVAHAAKVSVIAGESEPAAEPVTDPVTDPAAAPKKSWFVMRDLKRANAKMPAYKLLMEKNIEVFTPMHTVLKVVKGRQQKVQEPFVRDLLFVHDTRDTVDPIVDVTPTLQYRYERGKGYKVPMVVRDVEMNRFILAVTASKSTKYYTPGELSPKMIGRNVRITGGPLEGYAGKLLKISGSRTKRLLVQLEGILSAGVEVDAQYIELL